MRAISLYFTLLELFIEGGYFMFSKLSITTEPRELSHASLAITKKDLSGFSLYSAVAVLPLLSTIEASVTFIKQEVTLLNPVPHHNAMLFCQ